MLNSFKSKSIRSWAALIAAYAIVLHSVLGGIAHGQQAALFAGADAVICYGNDVSANDQTGKVSLKHIPCALCVAGSGVPPEAAALQLPRNENGAILSTAPVHAPRFSRLISPRLSQGPPQTA